MMNSIKGKRIKNKISYYLIVIMLFVISLGCSNNEYKMVWSDEFNGDKIDSTKWEFQIGNGNDGWGNKEWQYYKKENTIVENGHLIITAKEEVVDSFKYTSSRLRTLNKGDWKYGKIEMRAKMPIGKGIWPAFWMMPSENIYGTWAASGEIDIMEYLGHEPNKVHGTIHYEKWPNNKYSGNFYELKESDFHNEFHLFSVIWEENKIEWFVDGIKFSTKTEWSSEGYNYPAPFDQKFHLILNLAVGGNWPGYPNEETTFPQKYIIDFIRVYQK